MSLIMASPNLIGFNSPPAQVMISQNNFVGVITSCHSHRHVGVSDSHQHLGSPFMRSVSNSTTCFKKQSRRVVVRVSCISLV